MAFLAAVPAAGWASLASTALTAGAAYQQAQGQKAVLEQQAEERREDANATAAESQRQAIVERRRAQQFMSRARAVAGASGAGSTDPSVTNILTGIETQGEVNALNAMYSGNSAARGYRRGARIADSEARAASTGGYLSSAATALGGGSSWYAKYGV